jgi:hypothetical protein
VEVLETRALARCFRSLRSNTSSGKKLPLRSTIFLPLTLSEEDMDEFRCAICTEEVSKETGIVLSPCTHHEFCRACIIEWLYHNDTCPLCRARIRGVVTPQDGYTRVRYLNAKGEELEEWEEISEENVQEDELEEADPVVVAPNPTPEDTPNHSPSSRSTPTSITSEYSDEIDEESRSQEILNEAVPPTRMGDAATHLDTLRTSGNLGQDSQLVMVQQFNDYQLEPLMGDLSLHRPVTPPTLDPSQPQLPELPNFDLSINRDLD